LLQYNKPYHEALESAGVVLLNLRRGKEPGDLLANDVRGGGSVTTAHVSEKHAPLVEAAYNDMQHKANAEYMASHDERGRPVRSGSMSSMAKAIEDLDLIIKSHISFDAMVKKLIGEGHDEESAKKIAAAAGNKKYGERRMKEAAHEHKPVTQVKAVTQLERVIANREKRGEKENGE